MDSEVAVMRFKALGATEPLLLNFIRCTDWQLLLFLPSRTSPFLRGERYKNNHTPQTGVRSNCTQTLKIGSVCLQHQSERPHGPTKISLSRSASVLFLTTFAQTYSLCYFKYLCFERSGDRISSNISAVVLIPSYILLQKHKKTCYLKLKLKTYRQTANATKWIWSQGN